MTRTQTGYSMLIIGAVMLLGHTAEDIKQLMTWHQMATPAFVGSMLGDVASLALSFMGGKILPTPNDAQKPEGVAVV